MRPIEKKRKSNSRRKRSIFIKPSKKRALLSLWGSIIKKYIININSAFLECSISIKIETHPILKSQPSG